MRGRFTPDAAGEQWCERRLLARIHRYTVKRLRAEIEPVQARDFVRFLFDWQRVLPEARLQGADAVAAVLKQLEGFEAPAGGWESDILPLRIAEYDPHWLDEHCRAGRFVWARLRARRADHDWAAGPVRSTPITLLERRNVKVWSELTQPNDPARLSYKPRTVLDFLRDRGASFFDDIADGVGMLPVEVEESLGELVALGFVNSDSFGGLRALLVPSPSRIRERARPPGPADGGVRYGRCGPVGHRAARSAGGVRRPATTSRRAGRQVAAAPLGRHLLEAARARGGLAAELARRC